MNSRLYFSFFISFFFIVAIDYIIAFNTSRMSTFGWILMLQAMLSILPFLLSIFLGLQAITKVKKDFVFPLCWSGVCVIYVIISIVIGFFNSESLKYIIGDAFRFLIPSIVVIAFLLNNNYEKLTKDNGSRHEIKKIFNILVFYSIIMALAKVALMYSGFFYGGGANQYYIHHFLLIVAILSLSSYQGLGFLTGIKFSSKIAYSLFIVVAIILTVLSFKREFWVLLFLTLIFIIYLLRFNKKGWIFFFIMFSTVCIYLYLNPLIVNDIFYRFNYTFNNASGSGLDNSSFERLAEIKGAMATLASDFPLGEWLFGRGSGAEYQMVQYFPSVKTSTGSSLGFYHHIHNMYMIILFRFGLIGLIIYLLPVLLCLKKCIETRRYKNIQSIILLACCFQFFLLLISGIAANSMYGSIYYGFLIVIMSVVLVRVKVNDKI